MNQFPNISFFDGKGKLLFSQQLGIDQPQLFRAKPLENTQGQENPLVHYLKVAGPAPGQPAILAIAVYKGGSDCEYEGTLIGEHQGKLKSFLAKQVGNNAEGGMYVGDLGSGRGYGLASWNFVWDASTESHADAHRYQVRLYRFDSTSGSMVLFFDKTTASKFGDPKKALGAFGLTYRNVLPSFPDFDC